MTSLKEKRIEAQITQQELAKIIGKDVPLISKFENFVCLPIPADAGKMVKALKCTTILELYDKEDINFGVENKSVKKEKDCYKLTVRLPKEAKEYFKRQSLNKVGYLNLTDWVNQNYKRLVKKINKKDHFQIAVENGQDK